MSASARSLLGPSRGKRCKSCGHGPKKFCHKGINGKGETGLCLKMTEVPEGTEGSFLLPTGVWALRCECTEWT